MAFVNEYIPEVDIEKYEIKKWDKKFQIGHYKPSWTVDHERNIYLRFIESGREELSGQWIFCFYWKAHHLGIRLRTSGGREPLGIQWGHYALVELTLHLFDPFPEFLEKHRLEILEDLKDALIAFKDFGVHSKSTQFTATFDF